VRELVVDGESLDQTVERRADVPVLEAVAAQEEQSPCPFVVT
jgi:hypothetical protein